MRLLLVRGKEPFPDCSVSDPSFAAICRRLWPSAFSLRIRSRSTVLFGRPKRFPFKQLHIGKSRLSGRIGYTERKKSSLSQSKRLARPIPRL